MKVLNIFNELKFSGAEMMLAIASSKFDQEGIESYALSTGSQIGDFADVLINKGVKVYHIPFSKNAIFLKKLYSFLKNNKFDIIHIHSERFFLVYIILAKALRTDKIFRTIHSTFLFSGLLAIRRKLMLKFGDLLGCQFLAIGEGVATHERKKNKLAIVVINNWIDTLHFKESEDLEVFSHNRNIHFVSVGACSPVKQHHLILHLVSFLKEQGHRVFYYHVGCGALEAEERELVRKLNIQDEVIFVGNQRDVLPWLRKARFFLMPSAYEGLGNACAEAMASGLIPVVNNVMGLKDLVTDDVEGLVVDFTNIQVTAARLITLNTNANTMSLLRANGIAKIRKKYSIENVMRLVSMYKNEKK